MKLDTSSYYPKPNLDDDDNLQTPSEGAESTAAADVQAPDTSVEQSEAAAVEESRHAPEWLKAPADDPQYEVMPDDAPRTAWEAFADKIATFLSWVLVPLLMPVYGVILAFNLSILIYATPDAKWIYTIITALFNVGVPALLVVLLKKLGMVNDLGLNGRRERTLPYIISIMGLGLTAWFMAIKVAPMWLIMFFVGGAIAGVINLIVNFRWKISAHAAGMAGIVALLARLLLIGIPVPGLNTWFMISIALTGLLGTARVWLGRHTVWQVLAGYVVGFCCVFFMTMI